MPRRALDGLTPVRPDSSGGSRPLPLLLEPFSPIPVPNNSVRDPKRPDHSRARFLRLTDIFVEYPLPLEGETVVVYRYESRYPFSPEAP